MKITLEPESISGRNIEQFHTLKFLIAKIIVCIKIWFLAHLEIQKFSSSLIKNPGKVYSSASVKFIWVRRRRQVYALQRQIQAKFFFIFLLKVRHKHSCPAVS